ncbi:MAG TPA: (Fe-S)-binding protein [Rhodocyclaceae bacterium]|nr:(Fe-S)-binding protein [Rhodocyclaceae bacterium]
MSASLEKGVRVLKEVIDAPIASYFNSCVHCGICAEACLFYTETGDPKYTPIHKLEPMRRIYEQEYTLLGRLKKWAGLAKAVTDNELAEWQELVYNSCTLCGRCSVVCPVGNDIVYMVRKMREGMSASGHSPEGIQGAVKRTVTIGSPMGVKLPAVKAQMKHVQADTGIEIPLDQEGVEYLVTLSSMEIMNFPEYLGAIARIMRHVGKTWTLSSEAFEATNAGMQIGNSDLARVIVSRIVAGAEKLKVKTVISPECGHAYTALRWEGANLVGRPFTFKVQHIVEVLEEFRAAGLLKLDGMETDRLTFHDPCQLGRRGGVLQPQRNLMKMVAKNFVEMPDAGFMNWCCGGGGGASTIEEGEPLRLEAFKRKRKQLDAVKPDRLVTACANCRIVLEEGLEHYNMDLPVIGLTETIAEHIPD